MTNKVTSVLVGGRLDKTAAMTKDVTAAVAKAVKTATTAKTPKPLHECVCGCGEMVRNTFRQGHDARVYGWAKRIERQKMNVSELKPITIAHLTGMGLLASTPIAIVGSKGKGRKRKAA